MRLSTIFLALFLGLSGCESGGGRPKPITSGLAGFRVQILDENLQPLTDSSVAVDGRQPSPADAEGWVDIPVGQERLYPLTFSAPGYYSMIHTLSDKERVGLGGQLPPVVLVEKKEGRVMLLFGGDAVVGRRYHRPNPGEPRRVGENSRLEDIKTLLTPVKPYLDLADYVSINLESPVLEVEPEERSTKSVVFFSYPETLDALEWAGVDYVSLGNNHTYDYHEPGMDETLAHLANSRLGYSGSGRNEEEALAAYRTALGTREYGFLGFVGWAGRVTPNQVAGEHKGGAALGSPDNIVKAVATQSEESVTVVQYHGSREYSFQPTDETRERLHAAVDTGADLIIAHHPHVLHGFELYRGKLIAYSLGNFMFDQYIYETQRSALLYVWMDGDQFHRAEAVPLYINGYRPTPAVDGIRDYVLRRLGHQSSLEGVQLGLSGGHGVVRAARREPHPLRQASHPLRQASHPLRQAYSSDLVSKPLSWFEQIAGLSFNKSGIEYRIGTDTWSLGDFEHEGLFGIANQDWQYSQKESGIDFIDDDKGYGFKLVQSESSTKREPSNGTHVGQKYFTRAWNAEPKSVVLSIDAPASTEVLFCLELRTRDMSTMEARADPVEQCAAAQKTKGQGWEQLVFDFGAPDRKKYRGIRFRLDFRVEPANEATILIDDLMLVSWGLKGISEKDSQIDIGPGQYNVVGFKGNLNAGCCELVTSAIQP